MSYTNQVRDHEKLDERYGVHREQFWEWLDKNEKIYQGFVRLALQMRRKGRTRWSACGVVEVLRWHTGMRSTGSVFKINNNYRAGMSRLSMKEFPELGGFFQLREQHKEKQRQLYLVPDA